MRQRADLRGRAGKTLRKGQRVFASACDVRHQIERRCQAKPAGTRQHPEILEVIIDIADRGIKNHLAI